MRMDSSDWSPIALPWQLWLSSALLLAGSIVLQRASVATRTPGTIGGSHFRSLLLAGGACALAFLIVQSWAWRVLLIGQVGPNGNPAGSFLPADGDARIARRRRPGRLGNDGKRNLAQCRAGADRAFDRIVCALLAFPAGGVDRVVWGIGVGDAGIDTHYLRYALTS
ncbi:hypothetical protein ACFS07_09870 [Undibacterium arcticum]